jgi:phosphatidate cytidylyltransferase
MAESTPPAPKPAATKRAIFFARSASTLALWALVFGALLTGHTFLCGVLVVGLGTLALREYLQMLQQEGTVARWTHGWVLLAGLAVLVLDYRYWATPGHSGFAPIESGAILLVPVGALLLSLFGQIDGPKTLGRVALPAFGFFYIPCLFAFVSRFHELSPEHWHRYVFLLLVMTKFTDMGAYITGSLIGRHKMIPHVSPGKTWEGTLGAFLFTYGGGCAVYAIFKAELSVLLSWTDISILSLILGVGAVIGDLVESVIKRSLGAKDSGKMLPGIGGALDLIDSILFTAPLMYLYLLCK